MGVDDAFRGLRLMGADDAYTSGVTAGDADLRIVKPWAFETLKVPSASVSPAWFAALPAPGARAAG